MSDKLKLCPFCGGEAKVSRTGLSEVYSYADEVTVSCKKCGCSKIAIGDHSKGGYADNSKCEQQAIEKWNTRVLTPAQQYAEDLVDMLIQLQTEGGFGTARHKQIDKLLKRT